MVQWELGQGIGLPSFTDETGAKRFVEGVGLAAIRDFAAFLRHDSSAGNPLAGRVDRVLGVGYSQTARLLKSLLVEGFNRVDARRLFDGLHLHASASGLADVLATGKGPASSTFFTPRFTHPEHRGVTEEPLSYGDIVRRATQRNGGVGAVGERRAGAPLMLVTNVTTNYYNIRASLSRTGATGLADAPLPDKMRIYDIAGVAPPPSRLMPLQPLPHEPTLLQAPLHLPGAIVQVPLRDADGNSMGGVRLPELAVPLGTHAVQNPPLADRACNLEAGYIAFASTQAARPASDARPSVAERYASKDAYLQRIERAARRLVAERFMLQQDVAPIVRAAGQAY